MELKAFGISDLVQYEEVLFDDPVVNKVYMLSNPEQIQIKGIPDGCVDMQMVYCGDEVRVYLAGSHMQHTDAHILQYGNSNKVFGVKFQPGVEFDALTKKNFSPNELIDSRCDITDICGMERLQYLFQKGADLSEMLAGFTLNDSPIIFPNKNCIVSYLINEVEKGKGNVSITELAEKTGYTQRYVDRVFKEKTGLSIKKYSVIIRLQYALDIMKTKPAEEVYDLLGYYDQAHFIHDFKNFTSLTPKKYQKMGGDFYFV